VTVSFDMFDHSFIHLLTWSSWPTTGQIWLKFDD